MARFADEMPALERLGRENFDAIGATVAELGIDCELELTGELDVAVEPHQVEWLDEEAGPCAGSATRSSCSTARRSAREVNSPVYEAGIWRRSGAGARQPGEALLGAARAVERAGVRICERIARSARSARTAAGCCWPPTRAR